MLICDSHRGTRVAFNNPKPIEEEPHPGWTCPLCNALDEIKRLEADLEFAERKLKNAVQDKQRMEKYLEDFQLPSLAEEKPPSDN